MRIYTVLALAFAPLSSATLAGEAPLYAPTPEWVTPAPPLDPAKLPADAPAFLLFDQQQMLRDGTAWAYADTAVRATNAEALPQMGTITLPWHPGKGDLTIHRVQILRGAETIDLIAKGSRFVVIRREAQLEQHQINGVLSATLPVEGLRVGDILRLSFSISRKDAALGGNAETALPLPAAPLRVHFARARLVWPDTTKVNWRSFGEGVAAKPVRKNGLWEIALPLPLAKQPEVPGDAPPRYHRPPLIEASSFASWADVSKAAASLYATKELIMPGSSLAGEVSKIAAATTGQRQRAAMALQLVQDQVRYLFNGMGEGNYVPQSPAETWQLRYGDCKAKTLLLLALLRELGIEAEPVLANSRMGDWVPERLPAFGAFDHVLVRAVIDGEALWLDGTQNGTRLADLGDTPPFRNVLPVRVDGAELMPVPIKPNARAELVANMEIDQSAGVSFYQTYKLSFTMRGQAAAAIRQGVAQADKSQVGEVVEQMVGVYFKGAKVVDHKISFDDAAATATIEATGLADTGWTKKDERHELALDRAISDIQLSADRARPEWQSIPVALKYPSSFVIRTRLKLPARSGFLLEGDSALSETIAGVDVSRTASLDGVWMTVEDRVASRSTELAPSQLTATRERLALARSRSFRIVAPENYPSLWEEIGEAKAAHKVDPILNIFQRGIEAAPDKAQPYADRASFLDAIFERRRALDDLNKALQLEPSVSRYLWRARLLDELDQPDKAVADFNAARALDPASDDALEQLATFHSDRGQLPKAIALVDERIAQGGSDKAKFMGLKADFLATAGRTDEALSIIDAAIAAKPGDPDLLNTRCWIRGTRNVALEGALKDCTKAIELADDPAHILDSRAMVYFRMDRPEDALADLDAAYALDQQLASSLYLRGILRQRGGNAIAGEADLVAARTMQPLIDRQYAKYGVVPTRLR